MLPSNLAKNISLPFSKTYSLIQAFVAFVVFAVTKNEYSNNE